MKYGACLHPDAVYVNGTVVTMDKSSRKAEAVATFGDKIAAVGAGSQIRKMAGPETKIVDLSGKTMVPGLIEPHNHFILYGPLALSRVDLSSPPIGKIRNIKELQNALRDKAMQTPKGIWVLGFGHDDSLLQEKRHPNRQDLDKVSTDHPIVIFHTSMHILAANSPALAAADVTKDTPQPVGGVIRKESQTGSPDGVLEEAAMGLLFKLLPKPDLQQRVDLLRQGEEVFLRQGVTSCYDAGVSFPGIGSDDITVYQKALAQGDLRLRITMMIEAQFLLKQAGGFLTGFGNERLKIGPAKIIGDGSIQLHTAWLTQPYFVPFKGDKSYRGYPVTPPEQLNQLVMEAHRAGYQISVHGNGDATIDATLVAFRQAQKAYPRPDARHRIEHCQTVREDQLDLIAELGVSPSFFVSHTFYWGDRHKNIFLGAERSARISPLKSALKRGIRFSIHSDCPVTPVSPLFCVSAAVNRVTSRGEVLGPEFCLTPEEALRAVTIDAAWQNFDDRIKGSIEVGKLADFTILAENPLQVAPERIKDIQVEEVVIGSQSVYKAK
jgi:predicted amidohydrolase YtcJ